MTHTHGAASPTPPTPPPAVPAWRLLAVLGGSGAIAGLLVVVGFSKSLPRIEANKSAALALAVTEVLKSPARYDTLYLIDNALTRELPAGRDPKGLEKIYLGYDSTDTPTGYAIAAVGNGFQDEISLIFGYDPKSKRLLAMKILGHKDTPGLGDKIEKDTAYTSQFSRIKAPLVPVKRGNARPNDSTNVQTITGATISSKAVIKIISTAITRWDPLLAGVPAAAKGATK
jgi:electron transport complex protein RnfG